MQIEPGRLRLAQRAGQIEGVKAGAFFDVTTRESLGDRLSCVALHIMQSRYCYNGTRRGATPMCFSVDGVQPSEKSRMKMQDGCAGCPAARWSVSDSSACRESWHVLLALRDKPYVPYWIQAGKGATALLRSVLRRVQVADYESRQRGNGLVLLPDFRFTLTSVKSKVRSFRFWTLDVQDWQPITDKSERRTFRQLAAEYTGYLPPLEGTEAQDSTSLDALALADCGETVTI